MGISIGYWGRLDDPERVGELVDEMRALCRRMGWWHQDVDQLVAAGRVHSRDLRGISLSTSRRCEWLNLHVAPDGRLVNDFYYAMLHDSAYAEKIFGYFRENQQAIDEIMGRSSPGAGGGAAGTAPAAEKIEIADAAGYNWVKTQNGGAAAHVAVCRVLERVKNGYASDLVVKDDAGYFESGDLAELERQLAEVELIIDDVRRAAARAADEAGDEAVDLEEFVEKLQAHLGNARAWRH